MSGVIATRVDDIDKDSAEGVPGSIKVDPAGLFYVCPCGYLRNGVWELA